MDQVKQDVESHLQKLALQSKNDPPPARKPVEPQPVMTTTQKAPSAPKVQPPPVAYKSEPTPSNNDLKNYMSESMDREMHVYKPLSGDSSMAKCKLLAFHSRSS